MSGRAFNNAPCQLGPVFKLCSCCWAAYRTLNRVGLHARLRLQIVSGFNFHFDSYSFIKPKQLHARLVHQTQIIVYPPRYPHIFQVYACLQLLEFVCFAFVVEGFHVQGLRNGKLGFRGGRVAFRRARISWWIIERMVRWWMPA